MNSFLIYLLEASICLAMFYAVYLIFKADTFYKMKRFYLIVTAVLSLIIPQVTTPTLPVTIEQMIPVKPSKELGNVNFHDTFERVVFGQIPEEIRVSENRYFSSIFMLLGIIYLSGVLYFLVRFIRNVFHIYCLYRKSKKEKFIGHRVIILPNEYSTFSFFNCIFLNNKNLTEADKSDVILHELVHIKQRHSFDILLIEICRILLWINPFIWLYKSSIVKVHECLADQYFVENKPDNIINYQSLLLKQFLSKINIELAHPFSYSSIKYRIRMMTKNPSKWWAKYKLVFVFPIIVLGLFAFSNADINLSDTIGNNGKEMEPEPKSMVFIPQGSFIMKRTSGSTVKEYKITVDPFWMKESEVTVKEYYEYLKSIKPIVNTEEYNMLLPDFSKAPFKDYFTKRKYHNHPIVGVSYKQASLFCMWKTNNESEHRIKHGKERFHDYRLPLESEWVYASFGGIQPEEIELPEITSLQGTRSGKSNDWGLFNIFDNVSEWTVNSYYPSNPDTLIIRENEKVILAPGFDLNETTTLNSMYANMEIEMISYKKYLQQDFNPGYKIIRGNNYENNMPDGFKPLDYHKSYEYVGFRYVRSYMGN